ncbi:MAG: NADH-quinone oxidoreductase subunit D, partial [Actinobacteria bacterium]|nr:NADH-quinone oxidoreductase subunit D [Actinomycetota bacterium]
MAITENEVKDPSQLVEEISEGGLATEEMILNVGPQHPSTHGVFRLLATIDGEKLVDAQPVIGYMHRGYEKLVEARDYRQITNLVSRMDWLSNIQNELPLALAVESLMELEVPPRAQYMRVIMCEINRILNHLMFFASFGAELGAITPTFYAFREREELQYAMEMATGGRLHFGFFRPGGLKEDVPRGFLSRVLSGVRQVIDRIPDYENLLIGNEIFKQRTIDVGYLPKDVAYSYGVTGPIARGSDISMDIRKDQPYLVYDHFDFDVPVGKNGDCFDRFWVLLHEVVESAKIIEQAIEGLPAGPIMGKVPRVVQA